MANIQTISNVLMEIQAAYPSWKATEDTIKVWTVYLVDMDDALLVAAIRSFISSSTHAFAPSIPEIRAAAAGLKRQSASAPTTYEAWEEVLKAEKPLPPGYKVIRDGQIVDKEDYTWPHPIVERVARQLGWPRFPDLDNEMADRAHFFKAYDHALATITKTEMQLPQVTKFIASAQIKALADGMSK